MFEKLRHALSRRSESDAAPVRYMGDYKYDRRMDEIERPGMDPRLQRTLRGQNEADKSAYFGALMDQKGVHFGVDGRIVELELVDPETGKPASEVIEDAGSEPDPSPPLPPPQPPSVA